MRAYNTSLGQYVDWIVDDTPDSSGIYSGHTPGNLTNITVNKVVQSKVENFLKPLIPADGYYFHLNGYDWINPFPPAPNNPGTPIPVPSRYVGVAVVRGTTNATLPTPTKRDFATITWDEVEQRWKFVFNTAGDHLTLGAYLPVNVGSITSDGYLAVGSPNPAQSGVIRIPNNLWIEARRGSGTTDGYLIRLDATDRVQLGTLAETPIVYVPGNIRVDGYVRDGSTNVPVTGFVRNGNNTTIVTARDQQNVNDHALISTNNVTQNNNLVLGNATANFGNILFNTVTAGLHQFQTNTTTFLELGTTGATASNNPNNFIRFPSAVVAPSIYQTTAAAGSGQVFNLQAQSTTAASQTGGSISLTAGSAPASGFGGTVDFFAGATGSFPVAATLKMRIHPTVAPTAANNNSIEIFENLIRINNAQTVPRYRQDDITTSSTNGQPFTVQAQNATGATSNGGALVLTSGTGTTIAGNVQIQTGGIDRIIVSPTQTFILGNLLVGGTTTSIASTVVELADRVIHLNSSANIPIGTAVPVPAQITGFSIDRGQTGGVKRDYYGLFWHETDQYWKFAINTDGYTTEQTLSNNLPTMASYYFAQPTAALTIAAVPTVGGFRALNNTTAVASRNQPGTQDLPLLGTDTSNRIIHGSGTNNGGHLFNTTASTIYDFQVNSVSTYTITPISSGTTTLQATAAVTALVYTQTATGGATGANTTMSAQNAATTGGNLILSSGTGVTAGNVQIQTGAVDRVVVRPTFTEFRDASEALRITPVSSGITQITYAATVTAAQVNQTATGNATGAPMTVQAQNASTTGGALTLTSGTGATAGDVNIQTGAVSRLIVHPTFTEFRDTAEAYRITPVSAGTTTLLASSTVTAVGYRQGDIATSSATGATTTIQAQNATGTTSTGGNVVITSGTGTTVAGNVITQTGGTDRFTIAPTSATLNLVTLQFASAVVSPLVRQSDDTNNGITGNSLTVQAQNATGTTSVGGALNLTSGTGTSTNGAVNLQVGGTTTASLVTNKFVYNRGRRRNVTTVTGTYAVLATDDYIAVTTLAAPFTITLPTGATVGDTYEVKDATGNAGTSTITIDGNGANIDGASTFAMTQPYASAVFTFLNGQWSVT